MDLDTFVARELGKPEDGRFGAHAWRFGDDGRFERCGLAECRAVSFARSEDPERRPMFHVKPDEVAALFDADDHTPYVDPGCTAAGMERVVELAREHLGFTGRLTASSSGQSWNVYRR
ncbi:hypothetical protein [Rubrivirga marina]|uniref:Uncharacterized protein n=1 Tax=Rubrivirga marina TaxID=1196024 RepID=A0A271IYQ7_9BACT|nr:hypothetical protein [Rubrivirga marina]PAP76332.1 hypothetical protein BSZ37_07685 [Rubrivirga marina]